MEYVTSEHALLQALVGVVRRTDPDFLIGYEVVMSSWGYLIDRAAVIDVNLVNEISRMPSKEGGRKVGGREGGRGGRGRKGGM